MILGIRYKTKSNIHKHCLFHSKISDHIFRVFDCDEPKDSKITFPEFMMVYNIMAFDGHHNDRKVFFERMFDLFDVNGDGVITKNEMKKVVKDLMIILEEDNNNADALEIFKQMDANSDDKITKDEFVNSIMTNNTFGQDLAAKCSQIFGKHIARTSKGQISS